MPTSLTKNMISRQVLCLAVLAFASPRLLHAAMDCEKILRTLGAIGDDGSPNPKGSPISGLVWRLTQPSKEEITSLGSAIAVAELSAAPQALNRVDPARVSNFFAGDLVQDRIAAVMRSPNKIGKIYAVLGEDQKEIVRIDLASLGEGRYELRLYLPREDGGVYGIHPDVVRKIFASDAIPDHQKDGVRYEGLAPAAAKE